MNMKSNKINIKVSSYLITAGLFMMVTGTAYADDDRDRHSRNACRSLPDYEEATRALDAVTAADETGLNNDMWLTLVDRDGVVCVVTRSGGDRGDQWPGSRVISAQKANTANAFSLPARAGGVVPGLSLSTANLYSAVQPGGSLFGLQESNPVDTEVAYGGDSRKQGHKDDPMVGKKIGGVNVFGGGLALYDDDGNLLGALGVSGDTSCADHVIAWKVRDALGEVDHVPAGVSPTGDDNMIQDIIDGVSAGGFGHPDCGFGEDAVIPGLPVDFPIGD